MTSETPTPESSGAAQSGAAAPARGNRCGMGDRHIHRDDVRQIWRECQSESFWYRALPISVTSMAITGALIYKGVWSASKRFGPFPKLALAGVLGFAVGKASYARTCRARFESLGPDFGPGFRPGFGPGFGPWSRRPDFAPGHRHCHHVCEECKRQEAPAPAQAQAQPAQS
ncbi:OCIA domain-containing protein 2 [Clupea harengus]|uniref:OCIA domain-containing protein 2 n=1 Tax=Clupea harengus TaxID=7950 RepID=A0A6P8G3Y8_CLUHA|nr:OCIA domain-containing protein 2 [Clupea harengus]XP_031430232.1 OCIA domain-containing protein 2 [Clupea harengus]